MSYTPPPVIGYAAPQMYSSEFVPSAGRAKLATIFLWVAVGLSALSTVGSIAMAFLLDLEAIEASGTLPTWFWPVAITIGIVAILHFVAFILSIIFVLRWQHQAQSNLYAIGRPPEYTAGWGVGYWFIPIMNLFRPFQNLRDVSSKSTPSFAAFPHLGAYWTCWLVSNITSNVASKMPDEAISIAAGIETVSLVFEVIAAILLVQLMRYVIEGQSQQSGAASNVRTYR